ncbi:MAG: Mrp/NBP35 family ATP-binding protein [Deltaproteobacteria bacterium]|nr:Mrp/NBP35 family ATP-binding protein [Deltaproteobacteria bacterium]
MGGARVGGTTPGDMERAEQDNVIKSKLGRIDRKIFVMSGKGGVGKSTVAAYLALLLSQKGYKVGLMDVDLHGPSVPLLFNVQGGLQIVDNVVHPYRFSDHLGIVSMGMLLGDRDAAVIWRGPLKISAIRQFISDIEWGDLDFLIIDSPPGTGDEPLTVAQTIPDAEAVIVTTPQEISLADVRKSITFCRQVHMTILGVVENMSGLSCPYCGKEISLFGKGGGMSMAAAMGVSLLGEIPIDPEMVKMGDKGGLDRLTENVDLEINRAYDGIIAKLINNRSS